MRPVVLLRPPSRVPRGFLLLLLFLGTYVMTGEAAAASWPGVEEEPGSVPRPERTRVPGSNPQAALSRLVSHAPGLQAV